MFDWRSSIRVEWVFEEVEMYDKEFYELEDEVRDLRDAVSIMRLLLIIAIVAIAVLSWKIWM